MNRSGYPWNGDVPLLVRSDTGSSVGEDSEYELSVCVFSLEIFLFFPH